MGFIEALLGSGLANAIALHSVAGALKEKSLSSINVPYDDETIEHENLPTGIQVELYGRANEALNNGNYQVAIPLLIRAIKADLNNYPECYGALGVCYHVSGQFEIALECYDRTLHLAGKLSRLIGDVDSNKVILSYLSKKDAEQIDITTRNKIQIHNKSMSQYHIDKEIEKKLEPSIRYSFEYEESIRELSEKCEKKESIGKGRTKVFINGKKINAVRKSTTKRVRTHTKVNAQKSKESIK